MMTIDAIWQDFLKIVREEAGSRVVETWFKAVSMVRWDAREKIVYLQAPNQFVKQWISTYYMTMLRQHLERLLSEQEVAVVFVGDQKKELLPEPGKAMPIFDTMVMPDGGNEWQQKSQTSRAMIGAPEKKDSVSAVTIHPAVPMTRPKSSVPRRIESEKFNSGVLNDQYRFDTFVVGPSNALAFSAAQAAAENIGVLYNPLFIYGGSGLGKTHLLHAFGNYVREHNRKLSILYQSADRFVQEFITSIRTNKVYEFEARYKNIDVLLVDDVQFISKKEQTQEAFFSIFNLLHQARKQIVFSSDSMPCDIVGLAERMRSRLEGGLIADIQMPSLETKIAILHKKAEAHNYVLDDDVAYFIASQECASIRELGGMLIRVVAYVSLIKQPMSVGVAKKVLQQQMIADHKKESVGLVGIAKFVGKYFNYNLKDMRSSKRNKDLVLARHVAMYLMKKITGSSLRDIGLVFERRDHTTVLHAIEKIESQVRKDRAFAQELKNLEKDFLS